MSNDDHQDPAIGAMKCLQTRERLPDAVRRMADIDNGQRLPRNDLETAGPNRVTKSGSYRGFDRSGRFLERRFTQPKQE
jgi:hypothetical protein